ncbi:hypothetical protein [Candidatus Albibeggiatoa sp. nov. BB20]|uniref:hypothetical protein n=1 Tax=Candidatus Albibeggiatoa sp. nov. BB20 TaxID=3162723 RepID=UPI00336576B6
MRWYCTVESAANNEFSVLAAIESVVAVSLSLWVAWHYETVLYIAIASAVAPLLLLRTEDSTVRGLEYFEGFILLIKKNYMIYVLTSVFVISIILKFTLFFGSWLFVSCVLVIYILISWLNEEYKSITYLVKHQSNIIKTIGITCLVILFLLGVIAFHEVEKSLELGIFNSIIFIILMTISGMIISSLINKFLAIIISFISNPIESIKAIPQNWYRIVFASDSLHLPELVPGIELKKYQYTTKNLQKLRFTNWFFKHSETHVDVIIKIIMLLMYVSPILYRYSLKSTALFYLPFVYIIGNTSLSNLRDNFALTLDLLKNSALSKIQFMYALIVVILFTAMPLVFESHWQTFIQNNELSLQNHAIVTQIIPFFFLTEFYAWHTTRLLAALITLFLYFYVDRLIIKHKYEQNIVGLSVPQFIFSLQRLRTLLSLFTLYCAAYLLYAAIDWQAKFQNFQLIPWQN